MKPIVVALLAAATMSAAHAQTVYRCGNTYSQAPCPEATRVDVGDARSPAQQADARRLADDEQRLAAEMRRDRLAAERALEGREAGSLSGHAPAKLANLAPRHRKNRAALRPLPPTEFITYAVSSGMRPGP